MNDLRDPLEIFWDAILSRRPDQILAACARLSASEQQELIAHLQRMASEPGWHTEQRKSAKAALKTILNTKKS